MNKKFRYASATQAVSNLQQQGFDKDFRIEGEYIVCEDEKFDADELKISVVYRYEGQSDPGDETTVYGIETHTGIKGILLVADGIYSDADSMKILKKLHKAKIEGYQ